MHVTLGDWAKEVGHDLHRMNNCTVLLIQRLRGRTLRGKHALIKICDQLTKICDQPPLGTGERYASCCTKRSNTCYNGTLYRRVVKGIGSKEYILIK